MSASRKDVSLTTPSLEAPSSTSTNVKSIKKTIFHPAEIESPIIFLPASSFVGNEAFFARCICLYALQVYII